MATTTAALPYFLYASGTLFREGLEALLVIIALVAGVRQAGQADRVRPIYAGAIAALATSLVLAWSGRTRVPLTALAACYATGEPSAGLTAFLEKRPPRWRKDEG